MAMEAKDQSRGFLFHGFGSTFVLFADCNTAGLILPDGIGCMWQRHTAHRSQRVGKAKHHQALPPNQNPWFTFFFCFDSLSGIEMLV